MSKSVEQYADLMTVVRKRFDLIRAIKAIVGDPFSKAEIAAFHGRKIIEAIAFGCLVAIENGLEVVPRDAQGQWNAETILSRLDAKKLGAFPSPSIIRGANETEKVDYPGINVTIEGQPERRLTREELQKMYVELHKWLHEINPYVEQGRNSFLQKQESALWEILRRLESFIERHTISIAGEMMFCVLRDKNDGMTKVLPLSKSASLYPQ